MMVFKNLLRPIKERYTNPMNLINFGIMGMNQRNVNYIGRYNKRNLYPLVDNKLKTKEIALKNGITTPKLLGVIRDQHDVQNIVEIIGKHKEFCITYEEITPEIMKQYTVIVNTTPLGMYPHIDTCPDIPYDLITSGHLLYDLLYNPDETLFMKKGKERGATVKNGLEMLLLQAFAAWEIWQK